MESSNIEPTSSTNVPPKRNYFEQYIPLYKKTGGSESSDGWKYKDRTSKKNDYKYSKPDRNAVKWQNTQRQSVGFSRVNIDGVSLNNSSSGKSASVHAANDSKVTSTPIASAKKPKNKSTNSKKQVSQSECNETIEDVSFNLSKSKPNKRNKSVSFQLEENDGIVIKRPKSDISNDTETEDSPCKEQKQKKKNKSAKENVVAGEDNNVETPFGKRNQTKHVKPKESSVQSYADKETGQTKLPLNVNLEKNINKLDKAEDATLQSIPNNETKQNEEIVRDKKFKKHLKKVKKSASESDITEVPPLKKKPKKQKHQDITDNAEGEPAPKSPKTGIADNLESLTLGDNPHTLTNLINEMTVVDKVKKKKLKKEFNRDKTLKNIKSSPNKPNENSATGVKQSESKEIVPKNEKETGEGMQHEDIGAAGDPALKKWEKKHWNKKQKMNNDKMTLNVDNLPVSLLKGNFKKVLIDHFSEYGLYRGVGEPYTVNEDFFSTRIYFDTIEAATKALKRDRSLLADNEIRVSEVKPKTETTIVVRIYGPPQKLNAKDLQTTFREFGIIRSVRLVPHRKKTMTTSFVEFDSQEAVDAALKRSVTVDLSINGATIMVDKFEPRETKLQKEKKKKIGKKKRKNKKSKSDSENVPEAPIVEESGKNAPVETELDNNDDADSDYSDSD